MRTTLLVRTPTARVWHFIEDMVESQKFKEIVGRLLILVLLSTVVVGVATLVTWVLRKMSFRMYSPV